MACLTRPFALQEGLGDPAAEGARGRKRPPVRL